ncbi:transposase [Actinomyces oris]|uniref:transposase n=1 Tax=Actinomyces oris TaxID=544580 RepID=UPI00094C0F0D|nr:transposase [Actinomyces oris]OLO65064.1 hypothetical protein BKH22_03895 [Actinomyces oris]
MVVASTDAAATALPHLARQLIALHSQQSRPMSPPRPAPLAGTHPHTPGPNRTCPGSGAPAAAVLAGRRPWARPPGTGAQLASYAGLAPVTRRSGSSIRGEHVSHGGNKRLKRTISLSTFTSLRSGPVSQAY